MVQAKGVDGIREVKVDIEVEPGAGAGKCQKPKFFQLVEHATITVRGKSRLLWNRNTNDLDIEVDTASGAVTQKGNGGKRGSAGKILKTVSDVVGVKKI